MDSELEKFKKNGHYCNVGRLLDFIEKHNIPRDGMVLIQRVHDVYFDKHNWTPIKKEGFHYHNAKEHNDKVKFGVYMDREQYPRMTDEMRTAMISEEEMEQSKEQYVVVFCPVKYQDDDNLYLDAHY
jgi:hypothetical protein